MTEDSDLTEHAVNRIFGAEELHRLAVDTLPKNAPPDHHNAFVLATTETGFKVGLHYRKDFELGTWDLEGAFLHNWAGGNGAGISSVFWF